MFIRQLIYLARVFAVLLIFGDFYLLGAQKRHMCCTVEDCEKRQVEQNLQVNKSVHLSGSLTDQSGAPFKLSKVELRLWISPTRQTPFMTVTTNLDGHFDLGNIEAGQYRFLASEAKGFQQPSHLVCLQKECRLEVVLRAASTDTVESICSIR